MVTPSTEIDAFRFLVNLKYGSSPLCPSCGHSHIRERVSRRKLICAGCLKEWSPLSATLFHRSHLPLTTWLGFIHDVVSLKGPVTATRLMKKHNVGSYTTGWYTLARIRKALSKENRAKIQGVIEMDDLVIRGVSSDYRKTIILGALQFAEMKGKTETPLPKLRLKLIMVNDPDEMRIKNILNREVAKKSRIYTDDRKLYLRNWLVLNHFKVISSQERGHPFSIRGILQDVEEHLRVDHGGIQEKFLQDYLDEAVFLLNHIQDEDKGFKALIRLCLDTKPVKKSEIFKPSPEPAFISGLMENFFTRGR